MLQEKRWKTAEKKIRNNGKGKVEEVKGEKWLTLNKIRPPVMVKDER